MAYTWDQIKEYGSKAKSATYGRASNRLEKSYLGRSLKGSIGEMFGYQYKGWGTDMGPSQGWLGHKEAFNTNVFRTKAGLDVNFAKLHKTYGGGILGAAKAAKHTIDRGAGKALVGMGGKLAMGSLGIAFSLYSAYSGYQEGGVLGAAKSLGETALLGAGLKAGIGIVGSAALATGTVGVALGYGAYRLSEAGAEYKRGLRQLEFGGNNMVDAIGSAGAATSRQRAVMALQNTHLNGRMALGNEASVLHGIASYR